MLDFEIQRCTRRCAATGEEIQPGEVVYSVLQQEGGKVTRLDYSKAGWPGPPDCALGWWQSVLPTAESKRAKMAPNDVLLAIFEEIGEADEEADLRYVLALLLIRRRLLRLEDTQHTGEQEFWLLYCPQNENEYRLPVVVPDAQRAEEIQQKLSELLSSGDSP